MCVDMERSARSLCVEKKVTDRPIDICEISGQMDRNLPCCYVCGIGEGAGSSDKKTF